MPATSCQAAKTKCTVALNVQKSVYKNGIIVATIIQANTRESLMVINTEVIKETYVCVWV